MILVTGGCGYIGSVAVKALLEAGRRLIVLDDLSTGSDRAIPAEVPLYRIDLKDRDSVRVFFRQHSIEQVMHFAAHTSVSESVENPLKYYRNNVVGTLNLLEAMKANQVKTLVFSSTAAVYGEPVTDRVGEDHPLNPINPYGTSKSLSEKAMADLALAWSDFRYMALRYFNVCGSSDDGRLGSRDLHSPQLFRRLGIHVETSAEPFNMFGVDFSTPDGSAIRDFIHVDDLVAAHLKALDFLGQQRGERVASALNLGNGRGYSVKEVYAEFQLQLGKEIPCQIHSARMGDPARVIADPSLAQKLLGWKAQRTELPDLVQSSLAWEYRIRKVSSSAF